MAAKHREDVADLAYSEEVKAYIACNLELEAAVEYLLEELEINGELENTVIVLSADHYPYALSDEALNELVGHEVDPVFERYRNTIAIWSADQEHLEIDAPVCSLDILPTLLNLFGLEYDSRLLMGRDMFSDTPALVLFNDRSWITDEGRYDATNDILYGDLEPEYVDAVNQVVNAKFYYSAQILFHDYYRSLFPE
jgi:arylsulfatase A-like enzyme